MLFCVGCADRKSRKALHEIEEALAKYDFEAAHAARGNLVADFVVISQWDVEEMDRKITTVEVTYNLSNGATEKAFSALNEYNFSHADAATSTSLFDQYNTEAIFYNTNLEKIVNELALKNRIDEAINYCKLYYKPLSVLQTEPERHCKLSFEERDRKIEDLKRLKHK